jgi:transcriptional regulator with XRE-family HTH domain
LAAALRKAREASGMSVRELARTVGMSHATISKWENARLVPDVENVVAYLQAVAVTGDARERILSLLRGSHDPSWLASGLTGASQGLAGVLECERTAVEIVHWAPLLVPGPCQTRDTAHAILDNDDMLSPKELNALVDVRLRRREIFTNQRDDLGPAEYTALISANALRERPGGKQVAANQLRELMAISGLPTVTIQVVPSGGEWHAGLSGPFIFYNFVDAEPIVHIESLKASAFLYDESDVLAYRVATSMIRRRAMSPADSLELIADLINELESE